MLVAGRPGSGKTTLARVLAARLDLPHTELDALRHGPGWAPRPTFVAEVRALAAADRWVTEWQYDEARPLLAAGADLLVWLDLPVVVWLPQLLRRTLRRGWQREVLFGGNVEPPLRTLITDSEHIVRYGWARRHEVAERVVALQRERPSLEVVRLRSHAESRAWLAAL